MQYSRSIRTSNTRARAIRSSGWTRIVVGHGRGRIVLLPLYSSCVAESWHGSGMGVKRGGLVAKDAGRVGAGGAPCGEEAGGYGGDGHDEERGAED